MTNFSPKQRQSTPEARANVEDRACAVNLYARRHKRHSRASGKTCLGSVTLPELWPRDGSRKRRSQLRDNAKPSVRGVPATIVGSVSRA
jgi:hypothetical protein